MTGKWRNLLLSLLSGLLLSAAWYWRMSFLIFFAFVPLLIVEDKLSFGFVKRSRIKILLYAFLSLFTWNILTTWWVVYASFGGACMAFIFNSLFMAMVFLVFSVIKNRIGKPWAVWLLIPIWIAWEHGHSLWDLAWTWLTLGNVFAFNHNWVQWYEFTGTSGGTCWLLFVNILTFQVFKRGSLLRAAGLVKIAAAIIVPMFLSYFILFLGFFNIQRTGKTPVPVVVVQPNIDPYNAKFYFDYQSQFLKVLDLVRNSITSETTYLVLPETFITDNIDEEKIMQSRAVQWFRDSLISKFPQLKIVTGGNTFLFYHDKQDITVTSRKDERSGLYYDVFNTGIFISKNEVEVYHKSKLVPGVERMPFPALLKPLEKLAINMGGTMGSLGIQNERAVFRDKGSGTAVAPVICYESVFADYMTGYIRKGADFIFIITNDGWWEDTPGYIQHLNYARLRAIENRRQIARSANTGISCFIDEYGNISGATAWWKEAVIEKNLYRNEKLTFFSRWGDLISYTSVMITGLLLIWTLIPGIKNKTQD